MSLQLASHDIQYVYMKQYMAHIYGVYGLPPITQILAPQRDNVYGVWLQCETSAAHPHFVLARDDKDVKPASQPIHSHKCFVVESSRRNPAVTKGLQPVSHNTVDMKVSIVGVGETRIVAHPDLIRVTTACAMTKALAPPPSFLTTPQPIRNLEVISRSQGSGYRVCLPRNQPYHNDIRQSEVGATSSRPPTLCNSAI